MSIPANLIRREPTEAEFTRQVIDLARLYGWMACHFRPAQTAHGWRTAVMGDVGFPDIIMARGDRCVVAELKCGRNKLTAEQREWLMRLEAAGCEMFVWHPADWPDIEAALKPEVRIETGSA